MKSSKTAIPLERLLEQLPENYNIADRELIQRAYRVAEEAHREQKRHSGEPYINHCVAVAGILAEMRVPPAVVAAGLLHDIGKAVDQEAEGVHALIGADLAKRHGESPKVVHSIAAHHEDVPPENILAVLVQAADTLSGARPGARREMLETYVKRLEDLEKVALSFGGISKSYAIQAGREIRLIVESEKVNDEEAILLSREVAKKIEQDLTYPGQIKVTVIRETRSVEYAR